MNPIDKEIITRIINTVLLTLIASPSHADYMDRYGNIAYEDGGYSNALTDVLCGIVFLVIAFTLYKILKSINPEGSYETNFVSAWLGALFIFLIVGAYFF